MKKKAFTLIELLVVISIIAVLMSIMLPSLRRVREQGKSTVCKAHLHQWGLVFAMYTGDHNGKFMQGYVDGNDGSRNTWVNLLKPYSGEGDFRLCPSAKKTPRGGGKWPLVAWDMRDYGNDMRFEYISEDYGSYGINWWVNNPPSSVKVLFGHYDTSNNWRSVTAVKKPDKTPLLLDCAFFLARPDDDNIPPEYGVNYLGYTGPEYEMARVCHDRHLGSINFTLMDSSAQSVKLKELWDLEWHKNFKTGWRGEWPDWMN